MSKQKTLTLEEIYHLLPSPLSPEYPQAWKKYKYLLATEQARQIFEKQNGIENNEAEKKENASPIDNIPIKKPTVLNTKKNMNVDKSSSGSWTTAIILVIVSEILLFLGIIYLSSAYNGNSGWIFAIVIAMIFLPFWLLIILVWPSDNSGNDRVFISTPAPKEEWFFGDGSLRAGTRDILGGYKESFTNTSYKPTGFGNHTKR